LKWARGGISDIEDFGYNDFVVEGYEYHPPIAMMSVLKKKKFFFVIDYVLFYNPSKSYQIAASVSAITHQNH